MGKDEENNSASEVGSFLTNLGLVITTSGLLSVTGISKISDEKSLLGKVNTECLLITLGVCCVVYGTLSMIQGSVSEKSEGQMEELSRSK